MMGSWGSRALIRLAGHRCTLVLSALLIIVPFTTATSVSASDAAEPVPQDLEFNILRQGDVIGHHRITFRQESQQLVVRSELKIEVELLFFTAYRYEQTRWEVWRDRQLVALASVANDDGTHYDITGRAGPDGVKITSGRKTWVLPEDSVPASYWNVSMVTEPGPLIDAQSGKILDARVVRIGREMVKADGKKIVATHYRLGAERPRDLWYDTSGRWVKMRATGSDGSVAEWVLNN